MATPKVFGSRPTMPGTGASADYGAACSHIQSVPHIYRASGVLRLGHAFEGQQTVFSDKGGSLFAFM
jgi:hypothetical protein